VTDFQKQWYWDKRSNKAYYPVEIAEDTVRLVSVWHRDEVEGAVDAEALQPIEDVNLDRTDTGFDLIDSFRFPEDVDDE
jgi:hypothetical protein